MLIAFIESMTDVKTFIFSFLLFLTCVSIIYFILGIGKNYKFPSNYNDEINPDSLLVLYGVNGFNYIELDIIPNYGKICKLTNGLIVVIHDYSSYGRWLDAAEATAYLILDNYERIEIYLREGKDEVFITQVKNEKFCKNRMSEFRGLSIYSKGC